VNANNPYYAIESGILYNKAKTEIVVVPQKITGAIIIPDSVTSIGNSVFFNCTGLTSITISDRAASIGDNAFLQCTGLTSITIPNSVTSIGERAFYGCTKLTSVTFEGAITSDNFNSTTPFPGDLRNKYFAGGAGIYTRASGGEVWTKQP